jgi:hypothetical protein
MSKEQTKHPNKRIFYTVLALLVVGVTVGFLIMPSRSSTQDETYPNPTELWPTVPPRSVDEEADFQATREAQYKEAEITTLFTSGIETLGSVIAINGKPVQLPQDVYVFQFAVEVICIEGVKFDCGDMPAYTLMYNDETGDKITVTASGKNIYDWPDTKPEDIERVRERYAWLFQAVQRVTTQE